MDLPAARVVFCSLEVTLQLTPCGRMITNSDYFYWAGGAPRPLQQGSLLKIDSCRLPKIQGTRSVSMVLGLTKQLYCINLPWPFAYYEPQLENLFHTDRKIAPIIEYHRFGGDFGGAQRTTSPPRKTERQLRPSPGEGQGRGSNPQ